MAKVDYTAPVLTIADAEAAIAAATDLLVATAADLTLIDQLITACGQAAATWGGRAAWWLKDLGLFQTNTKTIATVANSGAARASNVTTITTTAVHGLAVGQFVKVTVTTGTGFDGIWEVASVPSTTTFTYAEVGPDVGAAAAGDGSIYVLSYPLRTINLVGSTTGTATMDQAYTIVSAHYDDDWPLEPMLWHYYRRNMLTLTTQSASQPLQYVVWGNPPQLFLWPPPASAYYVALDIIKRHSKITNAGSNDAALIVPGEFHWEVYVDGPIWLRKHKTRDPASLAQSPSWVDAMQRMAETAPENYLSVNPADLFPDAQQRGSWPHNRRVVQFPGGGYLIENEPSL